MTWCAELDPEMIRRRGTSGRAYRTLPIIAFHLWTVTRVNQTLAGQASGRVVVRLVLVLKQGGMQAIGLRVGASDRGPMHPVSQCSTHERVNR